MPISPKLSLVVIRDPLVVDITCSLQEAIAKMQAARQACDLEASAIGRMVAEGRGSCVLVTSADKLVGIVTERDILRLSLLGPETEPLTVGTVMQTPVITLQEEELDSFAAIANLFQGTQARYLPILDQQGQLTGLLTQEGLLHSADPSDLLQVRSVAEVMTPQVSTVTAQTPLPQIIQRLTERRLSSVVVTQATDIATPAVPIGLIMERDLVQFQALGLAAENYLAADVMSPLPFVATPTDSLGMVQALIDRHGARHAVVVSDRQSQVLKGILTTTDLVRAINPLELYKWAETLQRKVHVLEAEKIALLEERNAYLQTEIQTTQIALRNKLQQERLLSKVSAQIYASFELPEILATAVQEIWKLFRCHRAAVWEIQPDGQVTVIAEAIAPDQSSLLHQSAFDQCFFEHWQDYCQDGRFQVINDIYTRDLTPCHRELLEEIQMRSKILVPIVYREHLWGLLTVSECDRPRDWRDEEISLLRQLALQLGIALQQASTYQALAQELAQRRQTEQQLQQLNQNLEAEVAKRTQELQRVSYLQNLIFGGTNLSIIATDPNGIIQSYNRGAAEMLGYAPTEIIGQRTPLLFHDPTEVEAIATELSQTLGHPVEANFEVFRLLCHHDNLNRDREWTYLTKTGDRKTVSLSLGSLQDEAGSFVGIVGIAQDITERQRAIQAKEASEICLQKIFETSIVGMIWVEASGEILEANDRFLTMLGYSRAEFESQGLDWQRLTPPEYLERDQEAIAELQQTGHIQPREKEYYRKDGTRIPILLGASQLPNTDQVFCVVVDISTQKETEQALRHKTEELDRFFSVVLDLLCITDLEARVIRLNPQWQKTFGYDPEEMVGQNLLDYLHPEDLASTQAAMASLKTGKPVIDFVNRYRCRDGFYRWIEWHCIPMEQKLYSAARDITDRKNYEDQLQASNLELSRIARLKDEFLANMSHELRTPLNAVLGMSEALKEEIYGPLNERQHRSVQTIETAGTHLLTLINDILDLAKIEADQLEFHQEPTAIADLCESSLIFVRHQAHKKQIQLTTQIPRYLPKLVIDERRIRQVLVNLLSNAIKFTPNQGQVTLEVALEQSPSKTETDLSEYVVCFRVRDTGIGIAPEDLSRLFQPFSQIDSDLNRRYDGTGLGLALVKKLVENHGGTVHVTSKPRVGSCFSFCLPCPDILNEQLSEKRTEPGADGDSLDVVLEPVDLEGCRVLLAEDNPGNALTVARYLKAKGCRVTLANNGQEALDLLQTEQPNIILMDVQMPILDGLAATQTIRQLGDRQLAQTPIIALTALAMADDPEKCLAAGANNYLTKPVKLSQLTTLIRETLATTD
ncbi:MAG: PAS domain S-box protein [Synechococcus sp.]|nr:PAS domain S-box protein [Synechococcus sp.]